MVGRRRRWVMRLTAFALLTFPVSHSGVCVAAPADAGTVAVEASLVGTWRAQFMAKGKQVTVTRTIGADGQFHSTTETAGVSTNGSGTLTADAGKFTEKDDGGGSNFGTYKVISVDEVDIRGKLGFTTVWRRVDKVAAAGETDATGAGHSSASGPPVQSVSAKAAIPELIIMKRTEPTTVPSGSAAPFAVPPSGPMVQSPPHTVDLAHPDLPGPDPRYASWKGCKPGDYVVSALKFSANGQEGTGQRMDYLYAVDPDGVMVLTVDVTTRSADAPSGFTATHTPLEAYNRGYFTYYSATAVNPSDAPFLEGVKSGQVVPSPIASGSLGETKAFTYVTSDPQPTTLSVWTSPNLPNMVSTSVRRSPDAVTLQTVVACHRSDGASWSDPGVDPNEQKMLQFVESCRAVGLVTYTRIRDSWLVKFGPGPAGDRQVVQVTNVGIMGSVDLPPQDPKEDKVDPFTYHALVFWKAGTLRTLVHGDWTPWHNLRRQTGFDELATLDYFYRKDGWRNEFLRGPAETFFRPDKGYIPLEWYQASLNELNAALARPDAALPPDDKLTGKEADHWGNLVVATQSARDEDRRLLAHLSTTLPAPKGKIANFHKPKVGCTFDYDDRQVEVAMLDPNWVGLDMKQFDPHSFGPPTSIDVEVAAHPIYSGQTPSLEAEYDRAVKWHRDNKETDVAASDVAKMTIAGLDGGAFTVDSTSLQGEGISSGEAFAVGKDRTLRLTFTCNRQNVDQAWIQLRRIMESIRLQD